MKGKLAPVITALLLAIIAGASLSAASISQTYAGTLSVESGPGSVVLETFSLASTSTVTIYTTSYGGGMNLNGSTTGPGGFQPNLTLYNNTGFTIANQSPSFSPIANTDPSTGLKLDGYLQDSGLVPGTYYVTLTDWQNQASITATSLDLSDPSSSFSGPGGTSFMDVQGNTRTGNYALNLSSAPQSSVTPEPATLWLVLPVLMGAVVFGRKRTSQLSWLFRN